VSAPGGTVGGVCPAEGILSGLNSAQAEAVLAVRGPVVILAGAGTGKTTTITHRIANQVRSGAFAASQILAVTFTDKAARELKTRLAQLGVEGVEARTFHSAALAQLSRSWSTHTGDPLPDVLDHKAPLIASLANALPPPHKFLPRRELASEIEWAKNRMIRPGDYLAQLGQHEPPIPADLMRRVYDGYERRKRAMGRLDFEDMLALTIRLFDEHPAAAELIRDRFHAFTVDEFQDVNPLQAALLDRWLGDRDDLCVVGDDYQTIYTFTGASPAHLLGFAERFPDAKIVRLEESYRSSPEVLNMANRLAPSLGGFRKTLRATKPSGPAPVAHAMRDQAAEVTAIAQTVQRLHQHEGVPFEEIAVLYRINARSEPFEEAFAAASIPYQVRDGAFLRRPGPRAVLQRLKRSGGGAVAGVVSQVTDSLGFDPDSSPEADEEVTRQSDLARLRSLASEFERVHPGGGIDAFVAELATRFSAEHTGRGVNLLTYHRAKGLEFDAVCLPHLVDGELPFRAGRARAEPEEERRLLYVGITRARRYLFFSWATDGRASPSPFLNELDLSAAPPAGTSPRRSRPPVTVGGRGMLFDRLKEWRRKRAQADGVPAYVVFHDRTLADIAERKPRDWGDLAGITGVGPTKLERYADEVLAVVASN
jgi:DNA helicase II / ATP-dependent DNA helicase PcrA